MDMIKPQQITFLRLCSWHLTDSTTYVCPDENCQNKSEQMREQLWWGCVLCGLGLCRGDMLPTSSWLRLAFLKKTWKVETCTTGCEPQPHKGVGALWLVSRAPLFGHRTCSTVTVTLGETEVLTDWTYGHHLWHFLNENPHLCQFCAFSCVPLFQPKSTVSIAKSAHNARTISEFYWHFYRKLLLHWH